MKKILLPQQMWFNKKNLEINFPDNWKMDYCPMAGDKLKPLSQKDIERALDRPIGCDSLENIARGKKDAVILFDDMSRPTRPQKALPYILRKLESSGIKRENIRFLISSGSHGTHRYDDFKKKLGLKAVERYAVYNHNCFENCEYVGKTSTGVPLYINKEFLSSDLKIGIGSVLPHLYCGFSGGGKIVLPGVSGIKTIQAFHSLGKNIKYGSSARNVLLKSINEAVRMTDFQFKIDFLFNSKGGEIGCFAGEPAAEFNRAVKSAREAYSTKHGRGYDVIIANAYAKSNEADIALHNVIHLLKPKNSIFVLIAENPHGQMNHYLMRSYGKCIGGREYKIRTFLSPDVKYVVYCKRKDYNAFDTFDMPKRLIWVKSWNAILKIIKENFTNPRIAVFPDATVQCVKR